MSLMKNEINNNITMEIAHILKSITTPDDVHSCIRVCSLYKVCKIVEYVNRTGNKKDLFIEAIGESAVKIISLFTDELVNYYTHYNKIYSYCSIRDACTTLISMYSDYLEKCILRSEISDWQLEFMLIKLSLAYESGFIEEIIYREVNMKFLILYKARFSNNPEKIANLKTSLNIPDSLYDNVEEYINFYHSKSKYDLFLQIKQYSNDYIKLSTFIETLDKYSQDTEDCGDILISRKALNSALEVVRDKK